MITRMLLILLCLGILSIGTGCYFDPSPYNHHPYYRREGRSDQEQRRADDDQERRHNRRDRNQDPRGDESRSGQYDHGDELGRERFGR
jgi:hypothetical protein